MENTGPGGKKECSTKQVLNPHWTDVDTEPERQTEQKKAGGSLSCHPRPTFTLLLSPSVLLPAGSGRMLHEIRGKLGRRRRLR